MFEGTFQVYVYKKECRERLLAYDKRVQTMKTENRREGKSLL